eukprot:EG_transcript_36424
MSSHAPRGRCNAAHVAAVSFTVTAALCATVALTSPWNAFHFSMPLRTSLEVYVGAPGMPAVGYPPPWPRHLALARAFNQPRDNPKDSVAPPSKLHTLYPFLIPLVAAGLFFLALLGCLIPGFSSPVFTILSVGVLLQGLNTLLREDDDTDDDEAPDARESRL